MSTAWTGPATALEHRDVEKELRTSTDIPNLPVRFEPPATTALLVLVLALLPALAAVWLVPGFVTQDGPAHLYNARILLDSLGGSSPFSEVFEVHWKPLPNWAGHLALMGVMALGGSPWVADRVVMSATLAGMAGAIVWLRWRVRGTRGLATASLLAALLAMNLTWLLGFSSFLLGACLFPLTLGLWWAGRDRPGPGRSAAIAALLIASYVAHAVALGLTALGLVILELATPSSGTERRRRRNIWTAAALLPLVPLGLLYRSIMSGGGPIDPIWMELADPTTAASWWTRLVWVDPLTIAGKTALPFLDRKHVGFALLTPVLWAALGIAALSVATLRPAARNSRDFSQRRELRGWAALAGTLLVLGVLGPDSLGETHGSYLAQRVLLMGLIALVPLLDLRLEGPLAWLGAAALGLAVAVQSAFLWDYAARSEAIMADFRAAAVEIEPGERVGTLWLDLRPAFRANPLRHASGLLGVEAGAIVWSNYEAAHYYFPVQVRPGLDHPPVLAFEEISILDAPDSAAERSLAWSALLERYHEAIDVLVVQGRDPDGLDPITARWFEPAAEHGALRILRRRGLTLDPDRP